jgi:hypothetical protein
MQQRIEANTSLDDFPTPPWATRALLEILNIKGGNCREPAANRGHMVMPLQEYFDDVLASDIEDYGFGFPVADYLAGDDPAMVDWTITNPPFKLAEDFIMRAIKTSKFGSAVIVRSAFLESIGRYNRLFSVNPPSAIYQFSERVVMHKGKLTATGSTATAYSWLVWKSDHVGPCTMNWVPPCRKKLERSSDYPENQENELTT